MRKAVVPLAGLGTRLYPASSSVKKGLFALVDRDGIAKPVIQLIVEEALESGIEEMCLVVGPGEEAEYRQHFRAIPEARLAAFAGKEWALRQSDWLARAGERLRFVVQPEPLGYGHAVYQARAFAGGEPCLVMLGDHVYLPGKGESGTGSRCVRQLLDVFERFGVATSAVSAEVESWLYNFGAVRARPLRENGREVEGVFEVEEIVEKPTPEYARAHLRTPGIPDGQYLCWFGLHAMTPGIFDCLAEAIERNLRERGEIQFTGAQEMLRRVERYLVASIDGERHDTGDARGLIETQVALALRSPFAAETRRRAGDELVRRVIE